MPLFTSILTLTYLCSPPDYSCVAGVAGPQRDQRDRQRQLQGQREEADQGRSGHQEARGSPLQVGSTRAPDKMSTTAIYCAVVF